jgi:hypothetical protein
VSSATTSEVINDKPHEWEDYYDYHRPHGGLGGQTPYAHLKQKTTTQAQSKIAGGARIRRRHESTQRWRYASIACLRDGLSSWPVHVV